VLDDRDYKVSKFMNTRSEPSALEQSAEGDYIIPLKGLLQPVWKRLWIIVMVMILFTGAAVGWSLTQTPIYQASAKILIGQNSWVAGDVFNVASLQDLTLTMSEAVASRSVARDAVERLDLEMSPDTVLAGLSVEPVEETQFIEISYSHPDPEVAGKVANAVGEAFSDRLSEMKNNPSNITATVWESAETPISPVSPNPYRNGFLALVFSIVVGLGLVFLLEYLDDSWTLPEEAERVSGVPNLAIIPQYKVPSNSSKWKQG
jgi:capsular polysaccharide biosynthesis protein